MKKLLAIIALFLCFTVGIQAMDPKKCEIPLHEAYRLISQKLNDVQVNNDIKKLAQKEARTHIAQQAQSNRIVQSTAESIINDVLINLGLIVKEDTEQDEELARALALSMQLKRQHDEQKSLDLACKLYEQEEQDRASLELARHLQEQEEQEQAGLELAHRLQEQENQILQRQQEKHDLEFARLEQERLDRELARSLQQNLSEEKLSNEPQPKVQSPQRQMNEYRRRQQQRRQQQPMPHTTQQPLRNSNSSIHNGVFRPRPRVQTVQQPKYAHFNHSFGTQLNLPGITGRLRNCSGIYHVFSNAQILQQRGWTCGFHVLHNMCLIERILFGKNIAQNTFDNACLSVVSNPANKNGSSNLDTHNIAQGLDLKTVYQLDLETGSVMPTPTGRFIIYPGDSESSALQRAKQKLASFMWDDCKRILQANGIQCIHFVCSIISKNIPHAVLLSVIKLQDGSKALYIFDNMNDQEDRNAQEQICRLAQHIYDKLMR